MVTCIVNPTAGNGRARKQWLQIEKYLQEKGEASRVYYTNSAGHATELVKEAAKETDVIYVMGGDGTLREAVIGALKTDVTLGFLPGGSGNDFVGTLGIEKKDVLKAFEQLRAGTVRLLDVPLANGEPFMNIMGMGIDSQLIARMAQMKKRRLRGMLLYFCALLSTLRSFAPIKLSYKSEEVCGEHNATTLVAANGQTFGGGMRMAPKADPFDGLFDVCTVSALKRRQIMRLMPKMIGGNHLSVDCVTYFRCKELLLSSDKPLLCQADGEPIQMGTSIHFTMSDKKIPVLVP